MNNIGIEVIIGIVSGIITSLVIFSFLQTAKLILLPWYQRIIYKGINISGEWFSATTPFPQTIKLELNQKANQIIGIATYVNQPENLGDIEKIRTFRIEGGISDRFIQMTLRHSDPSRLGIITYLFEVVGDGRKMEGASSHYDLADHRISHADISFTRTEQSKLKKTKKA